jgi:hypothetical protein
MASAQLFILDIWFRFNQVGSQNIMILLSGVFHAIIISIGICNNGGFSKGLRAMSPDLNAACKRKCFEDPQGSGYEDGKCPRSLLG